MVVTTHLLLVETDVTLVAGEQDITVVQVEVDHPTVEMVEVDQDILVDTHHIQLKVLKPMQVVVTYLTLMLEIVLSILDRYHMVVDIATTEEMVIIKVDLVR